MNVGTGRATTVRAVAGLVAAHFPGTRVLETPMPPGDPLGGCAGTALMRRLLGREPAIGIEVGVVRYVRWLRGTPAALPAGCARRPPSGPR